MASVEFWCALPDPRLSLPRAGSRSPAKPCQARPARPRRRPQPRPAALSAQGWVSHRVRAASGAVGAARLRRSAAAAAQSAQISPAGARPRGSGATTTVPGLEPQGAQAPARERSLGPARDDERRFGLGQWVSAGPAGPRPASPPAQSGPWSPNEPRCAPSPAPSPLLAAG